MIRGIKKYYSRDNDLVADEVRKSLRQGFCVIWETTLDPHYNGNDFADFVQREIKGEYTSIHWGNCDNYWKHPRTATITPKNAPQRNEMRRGLQCTTKTPREAQRGQEIGKDDLKRLVEHWKKTKIN